MPGLPEILTLNRKKLVHLVIKCILLSPLVQYLII